MLPLVVAAGVIGALLYAGSRRPRTVVSGDLVGARKRRVKVRAKAKIKPRHVKKALGGLVQRARAGQPKATKALGMLALKARTSPQARAMLAVATQAVRPPSAALVRRPPPRTPPRLTSVSPFGPGVAPETDTSYEDEAEDYGASEMAYDEAEDYGPEEAPEDYEDE